METLIVKVDTKKNVSFLRKLLQKLNFVSEVQSGEERLSKVREEKEMPIEWAKSKPSIKDFAGIWKNRDITTDQLRKKAWERN